MNRPEDRATGAGVSRGRLLTALGARAFAVVVMGTLAPCALPGQSRGAPATEGRAEPGTSEPTGLLPLTSCRVPGIEASVRCGSLDVWENRAARTGRRISLPIVVLPARRPVAAPDPVFFVAGGPGQAATALAARLWNSPFREEREIVLVDQRGTGGTHALNCVIAGSDDDVQRYLDPIFGDLARFDACRRELERRADLRWYGTIAAADDLDDVRAALGYETINLVGASYGTRAILVYARRHPARVRAAILTSVVPLAFRNPLHHARAAQDALDELLAACDRDARCRGAYPALRTELDAIIARLDRAPAHVTVVHPATGRPVEVSLTREAFAEALRVTMYATERARMVPLLIHRAHAGDFTPFASLGLTSNRNLRNDLRLGVLMSVVCAEDVSRITEADIRRETRGTLLGDARVRSQMAACAAWPKSDLPRDHAAPVSVNAPILLVSGTLDPVTPPRWGEEAARHLPNSLHIVVPGGHGPRNACIDAIATRVIALASTKGIDTGCVRTLALPAWELPRESPARSGS